MPTNNIAEYLLKCDSEKIKFINIDPNFKGANWLGRYLINKNICEEEQTITLIHELLHDLPKYKDEKGNPCGSDLYPNHKLHIELEKEAKWIYHNRPIIKNLVIEKLKFAKQISQTR